MELKEYLDLIKKHKKFFFLIWAVVFAIPVLWFASRPAEYESSIAIEITRKAIEGTSDYQYDYYYRLEADDLFAETISNWLKDPGIANEIYREADVNMNKKSLRLLSKAFSAEKLAPNYIEVRYKTRSLEDGKKIASALRDVVNQRVENLNKETKDNKWFMLIVSNPTILKSQLNLLLIAAASFVVGLFLAIFGVLFRHYIE